MYWIDILIYKLIVLKDIVYNRFFFTGSTDAAGDAAANIPKENPDLHSLIGLSLVIGFVLMLLIDQCSTSHSRGQYDPLRQTGM